MFFRTLFYGLMGFVVALTPTRTVHALSQCELQCVIETGGGPDCFGADDRGYCGSHGGGGGGASGGSGSASTGSGGGNASSLSVCNFAAPPRWIPNVTAIYDTESTWRSDIALWENTTYSGKNPDEEEVLYAH
ncbi:MAG TPA: hypothetical protein VF132_14995, partial [Rudaea sp.]